MNSIWKPKVKCCINCQKKFRRRSESHFNVTNDLIKFGRGPSGYKLNDLYKGNQIAYYFREKKHTDFDYFQETGKTKYTGESGYSWHTWDGESYHHTDYYFCSGKCSKQFAKLCADKGYRRVFNEKK